jgi:hypothetical protein
MSNEPTYLLVTFSDNGYTVARIGSKNIRGVDFAAHTCECRFNNKWYPGTIQYLGSHKKCQKKARNFQSCGYVETDEDALAITQQHEISTQLTNIENFEPSTSTQPRRGLKRSVMQVSQSTGKKSPLYA